MTNVTLVTGLSSSLFSQFMQIGGILASLASVAYICSERHLKYLDSDKKDPKFSDTLKALLFFAPHVIWRTTARAFIVAFLKFYSLIPLTLHILVCVGITCCLHRSYNEPMEDTFFAFALSLFTPSVWMNVTKFNQSLLKATMLTSSVILLPCVILIRLLPLFPKEFVLCTLGLSHINLDLPIPECSPCFKFNSTDYSTGIYYVYETVATVPES